MHRQFELAGGGIIGRFHRDVPRNCQDDWHVLRTADCTVAVVADGCSEGTRSEVGASLGARLAAATVAAEAAGRDPARINWCHVSQNILAPLRLMVQGLGQMDREQFVRDHLLFTLVGCILTDGTATFFALGDGLVVINGEPIILKPAADNQPAYLGYQLVGWSGFELAPVKTVPLTELESFLIGTDGVNDLAAAHERLVPGTSRPVGPLAQFWTDNRYFHNPAVLGRQLKLIGRDVPRREPLGALATERGLLPDDTTMVVGRRKREGT